MHAAGVRRGSGRQRAGSLLRGDKRSIVVTVNTCVKPLFGLFGFFPDHHEQFRVYQSPWGAQARQAKSEGRPQYVTFEPDRGGFNNIR